MRRLPKPRATQANSTVPAMTKPAQPISAMCAKSPALTHRNGLGWKASGVLAGARASRR